MAHLDEVQVRSIPLEEVGSKCALANGHDEALVSTLKHPEIGTRCGEADVVNP